MNNLDIYEAGRSVPIEAQKSFSNGSFSGTDINPMWRIKKLTELFGPCGIGWYTEVLSERAETYGDTVMAIVDINLYIKTESGWSKPIFGTGGNLLVQATKSGIRPSDEGYKKAYTDALSIACKALGIGADIWYSKDPSVSDPTSKYANQYTPINGTPADKPPADYKPEPLKKAKVSSGMSSFPICKQCGIMIQGVTKDGVLITPAEVSEKTGGLCIKCAKEQKK